LLIVIELKFDRFKLKQFKYSEPEKTTGPSGVE
jgi:hypothetical protein